MVDDIDKKGAGQKGIKGFACWPFIPIYRFVVPLLHCLIGIGNDVFDAFSDWINKDVEELDKQEMRLQNILPSTERMIEERVTERKVWDTSKKGKQLQSVKNRHRRSSYTQCYQETTRLPWCASTCYISQRKYS